jgi:hypothetical protein
LAHHTFRLDALTSAGLYTGQLLSIAVAQHAAA